MGKHEEDAGNESAVVPTLNGEGRIVASRETLSGFHSNFTEQLEPGDHIIIFHPSTQKEESSVVSKVMSNRTCLLTRPFTSDFSSTTDYTIEKHSITLRNKAKKKLEAEKELPEEEFGKKMTEEMDRQLSKRKQT